MSKILLINPKGRIASGVIPLGLCYLSSNINKESNKVIGIDLMMEEEEKFIEDYKTADWVGISVTSKVFDDTVKLCRRLKTYNKNIKIVLGGPHATLCPEECLSIEEVDYIFRGEAEEGFAKLINGNINEIPGLCYKNHIVEPFFYKNLDDISFPDRELFNWKKYKPYRFYPAFVPVMASRSCPYQCTNCQPALRLACGYYRARSPKNVVDELSMLKNKYGMNHIWFNDNDLTINRHWITDFCNLLIESKLNIKWGGNGRGNTLPKDIMILMKKAGCVTINFGIEFCDQRVLTQCLNKRVDLETMYQVIKDANEIGIRISAYYMFGIPGSTKEEEFKSIDTLTKLSLNSLSIHMFQPNVKIGMNEIAKSNNWLLEYNYIDLDEDKCFFRTENWDPVFVEVTLKNYIIETFDKNKDWVKTGNGLIYRNIKVNAKQNKIIFLGQEILSMLKDFKLNHIGNIIRGIFT